MFDISNIVTWIILIVIMIIIIMYMRYYVNATIETELANFQKKMIKKFSLSVDNKVRNVIRKPTVSRGKLPDPDPEDNNSEYVDPDD